MVIEMYYILTVIISNFVIIRAQETTVVDLSEFENTSEISVLGNISSPGYSNPEKQALRYGFQQTKECKNFAKAYMCVRKCLDFNYDIAHSDKFCKCSCFMKLNKEKFTLPPVTNGTKWSAGAPTTTIYVTPKFPPTFEDEITSEPEDNNDEGEYGYDQGHDEGDDKSGDKGDGKGDMDIQGGDGSDSKNSGGNKTSGLDPEGDGLITSADGDDNDGFVEGGGGGSATEGDGVSATEGGGEGEEDKPAE